jgi:hypothetical protein
VNWEIRGKSTAIRTGDFTAAARLRERALDIFKIRLITLIGFDFTVQVRFPHCERLDACCSQYPDTCIFSHRPGGPWLLVPLLFLVSVVTAIWVTCSATDCCTQHGAQYPATATTRPWNSSIPTPIQDYSLQYSGISP